MRGESYRVNCCDWNRGKRSFFRRGGRCITSGKRDGNQRGRRSFPARSELHLFSAQSRPINREFIDASGKLSVREPAHAAADPKVVVVLQRTEIGRPAHSPRAFDFDAIDPRLRAVGLSKSVARRDVMPFFAGRKAAGARPAVPRSLAFVFLIAKQKRNAGHRLAVGASTAQAQCPVLVGASRSGAALARDINVLPVLQSFAAHPRFHRDGVALCKIERTFRAGIFHPHKRRPARRREIRRHIVCVEPRELRRARPRLNERNDIRLLRLQLMPKRRLLRATIKRIIEPPICNRRVRGDDLLMRRGKCCGGDREDEKRDASVVHDHSPSSCSFASRKQRSASRFGRPSSYLETNSALSIPAIAYSTSA